jgi:hypothetical protein
MSRGSPAKFQNKQGRRVTEKRIQPKPLSKENFFKLPLLCIPSHICLICVIYGLTYMFSYAIPYFIAEPTTPMQHVYMRNI